MVDQLYPAREEFTRYFEMQWIPLSSMISLVGNLETRTNNVMEGFNSYLSRNFSCHANLWIFLAKLKREEAIFFVQNQ